MSTPKKAEERDPSLISFPGMPDAESENTQPAPRRDLKYLWLYALGIFSVAIVLMLLSFLSQSQRAGELAQQQHMDFSASALKSIEAMQEENDTLRQDNADLNLTKNALLGQITDLQQQLDALLESNDALREELTGAETMLEQSASQYEALLRQLEQLQEQEG